MCDDVAARSADDLKLYRAVWRAPVFADITVPSPPPIADDDDSAATANAAADAPPTNETLRVWGAAMPFSGGAALAMMLQLAERSAAVADARDDDAAALGALVDVQARRALFFYSLMFFSFFSPPRPPSGVDGMGPVPPPSLPFFRACPVVEGRACAAGSSNGVCVVPRRQNIVWADRDAYMADADWVDVPLAGLVTAAIHLAQFGRYSSSLRGDLLTTR